MIISLLLQLAQPQLVPITCKSPEAIAAVTQAQVLLDDIHVEPATEALERAVKIDPDCATAQALLASLQPGPERAKPHLLAARAHAASLPPAERAQIDYLGAVVDADLNKMQTYAAQVVALAPGDWRAHNTLGGLYMANRDFDKAAAECNQAIQLNPAATGAYNNLGYTYALQEKFEDAAATFRKYTAIAPKEANAHDSLAEVLMNGGHFAEAESEFQKALAADPHFAGSWTGVAQNRLLRGDAAGANAALAAERKVDPRPQTTIVVDMSVGYAQLAEGKANESWKTFERISEQAKKLSLPQRFFNDAIEARLQVREGNAKKALALANASYDATLKADMSPELKQGFCAACSSKLFAPMRSREKPQTPTRPWPKWSWR